MFIYEMSIYEMSTYNMFISTALMAVWALQDRGGFQILPLSYLIKCLSIKCPSINCPSSKLSSYEISQHRYLAL